MALYAGFYDNTAYKRWLKMRNNVRIILGGGVLTAMHLAAEVPRSLGPSASTAPQSPQAPPPRPRSPKYE